MLFRHKLQVALLLFFILITAAASEETQFLWVCAVCCVLRAVCNTNTNITQTINTNTNVVVGLWLCVSPKQAVLPVMLSMLLLVDCMFLDSSVFMFDPDYKVRTAMHVCPVWPHSSCQVVVC